MKLLILSIGFGISIISAEISAGDIRLSSVLSNIEQSSYNELQGPVCDIAEVLAQMAIMYRLSGKTYTEALDLQRQFMGGSSWARRDIGLKNFIERIGLDLVDQAYMSEMPARKLSGDESTFVTRQWAKSQTQWCRSG